MNTVKTHCLSPLRLRALICAMLGAFLFFLNVAPTFASNDNRARAGESSEVSMSDKLPFTANEQLTYSAEFSRSVLRGIDIAELRFAAQKQETPIAAHNPQDAKGATGSPIKKEAAVFHFSCDVSSKSWFQRLFNLTFRLSMKSLVDAGTFAVARTFRLEEQGKRRRESEAVFDRIENLVTWTERNPVEPDKPPRVVRTPLQGASQDLLSVFYYLRMQPLKPGTRTEVALSDSGQIYRVPLTIGNRSKLKTVLGEIPVLEVKAEMFGEGRPLRGKGTMTLWFSDDARHVPVRARIKSDDGTLDIKLKQMKNDDE